jgi:O-antigen/teichoic acid export membrane protein
MLLYLAAFNLYNLLLYYLVGRLEVRFAAVVRVVVMLLNVALAAVLLRRGAGIVEILAAQGVTALLALLAALWRLRADLFGPRQPVPLGRQLRFAGTLGLTSGLNFLLGQQSDVFLIGLLLRDRAEIGAYNVAASLNFTLASALLIGFEGVSQAAFSEVAVRDHDRLRALWSVLLKLVIVLSVPALVFGAAHAAALVALFGGTYADSALLLQVYLLFSVGGRLLGGGLNTTLLYALGQERTPLLIRIVAGSANLLLDLVLIRWFGPLGAVVATGASFLVTGLVETIIALRATGATYPWRFAGKVLLATAIAVAASYPLTGSGWLGLALGAAATGALLLAAFALLRPLGPGDRALVARLLPRLAPVLRYF